MAVSSKSGQQADRGMVLPFEPLAMSFSHIWCAECKLPQDLLACHRWCNLSCCRQEETSFGCRLVLGKSCHIVILPAVCIRYSVPMPAGMEPGPDATKDGGKPRLHLLKVWRSHCPSTWIASAPTCAGQYLVQRHCVSLSGRCDHIGAEQDMLSKESDVAGCVRRVPSRRADGSGGRIRRWQDYTHGAHPA